MKRIEKPESSRGVAFVHVLWSLFMFCIFSLHGMAMKPVLCRHQQKKSLKTVYVSFEKVCKRSAQEDNFIEIFREESFSNWSFLIYEHESNKNEFLFAEKLFLMSHKNCFSLLISEEKKSAAEEGKCKSENYGNSLPSFGFVMENSFAIR